MISLPVLASAASPVGALPLWSVIPFALMLLSIAVLPLVAGHFWESNRNKALLSLVLGVPVALWMGLRNPTVLGHTAHEYVAFITRLEGITLRYFRARFSGEMTRKAARKGADPASVSRTQMQVTTAA